MPLQYYYTKDHEEAQRATKVYSNFKLKKPDDNSCLVPCALCLVPSHLILQTSSENNTWITLTSKVEDASGIHALWLVFYGDKETSEFGCLVNSFIFKNP